MADRRSRQMERGADKSASNFLDQPGGGTAFNRGQNGNLTAVFLNKVRADDGVD